jgi:hypothetical protein
MPKLIVASVWPVILFPDFLRTLPDLFFCWLGHVSSTALGLCRLADGNVLWSAGLTVAPSSALYKYRSANLFEPAFLIFPEIVKSNSGA